MTKIHLVFGPDGNRRYALLAGIQYAKAYTELGAKLVDIVRWSLEDGGIEPLTLWLLQEYNLLRDPKEVPLLVDFASEFIFNLAEHSVTEKWGLQLRLIGELDTFFKKSPGSKAEIEAIVEESREAKGLQVNIILAYNSDAELRQALSRCESEKVEPTFSALSQRWSIPPVNLFMRTGQPDGFVNLSSYWPLIERGRAISTPTYPQLLERSEFHCMIQKFRDLKDSVGKVLSEEPEFR